MSEHVATRALRVATWRVAAAAVVLTAAAACADDRGDSAPSTGAPAAPTATSGPTATTPASSPPAVDTTPAPPAPGGGELGDGYTITAVTAAAVDECLLEWHTVRTAATSMQAYSSGRLANILAICSEADEMVDEDNRGAPMEPLPVTALTQAIGQVLLVSSAEMRDARDRCWTEECTLEPERVATFLELDPPAAEVFGVDVAVAPTAASIEGLVII